MSANMDSIWCNSGDLVNLMLMLLCFGSNVPIKIVFHKTGRLLVPWKLLQKLFYCFPAL